MPHNVYHRPTKRPFIAFSWGTFEWMDGVHWGNNNMCIVTFTWKIIVNRILQASMRDDVIMKKKYYWMGSQKVDFICAKKQTSVICMYIYRILIFQQL